jgi:Icc-related predicted phosphoesterase
VIQLKLRLLATSDTHFDFDAETLNNKMATKTGNDHWFPEDIDVFIHAGDLMYHGTEREWYGRVESLASVKAKLKLFVPGNHDLFIQHYTGPANQDLRGIANVRMLGTHPDHFTYTLPNKMRVLGLPFVTDLPGWAYNSPDEILDYMAEQLAKQHKGKIDMIVSHSPPFGILDGSHFGVKAWNYLQNTLKPEYWICGHVHENYGVLAKNGTTFYNVAMLDRDYQYKNPPVLLEL